MTEVTRMAEGKTVDEAIDALLVQIRNDGKSKLLIDLIDQSVRSYLKALDEEKRTKADFRDVVDSVTSCWGIMFDGLAGMCNFKTIDDELNFTDALLDGFMERISTSIRVRNAMRATKEDVSATH